MTNNEPTSQDIDALYHATIELRISDQGTADQLAMMMVRTVQQLCMRAVLSQERAQFLISEDVDNAYDAAFENADLDEDQAAYWSESVEELMRQAEGIASELGYVVKWDDGYTITDLVPLTPRQRYFACDPEGQGKPVTDALLLEDYSDEALDIGWLHHNGERVEQPEHTMSFIEAVASGTEYVSPRRRLNRLINEYHEVEAEFKAVCEAVGEAGVIDPDDYHRHDDALADLAHEFARAVEDALANPEGLV